MSKHLTWQPSLSVLPTLSLFSLASSEGIFLVCNVTCTLLMLQLCHILTELVCILIPEIDMSFLLVG